MMAGSGAASQTKGIAMQRHELIEQNSLINRNKYNKIRAKSSK